MYNQLSLQHLFERIMITYPAARNRTFGSSDEVWKLFSRAQELLEDVGVAKDHIRIKWSVGQGNWARVPWIALLDERITNTTQKGVYVVFLFAEDMSGVYLGINFGVTDIINSLGRPKARIFMREEARRFNEKLNRLSHLGFEVGKNIDLHTTSILGRDYESSSIVSKFYPRGGLPDDENLIKDLKELLASYALLVSDMKPVSERRGEKMGFDLSQAVMDLYTYMERKGFVYQPWQIASFVTSLRTKPFVILAGTSGTGKSKMPRLVAEAIGGKCMMVPVRPDWTDSSEVIGYTDLQDRFHPGPLLVWAKEAAENPNIPYFFVIDEMNLARVEYYFAEVLSCMEERSPCKDGGFRSTELIKQTLPSQDLVWGQVGLPPNLFIVGTVNMDETTHGFSKKVLDRANTLEMSETELDCWENTSDEAPPIKEWPIDVWYPRALTLASANLEPLERAKVSRVIGVLNEVNQVLRPAQLQVGYRVRDEVSFFVLNAGDCSESFVTRTNTPVEPLDLALQMKILPRIMGGSLPVRRVVQQMLGWAYKGTTITEEEADSILEMWNRRGSGSLIEEAIFPGTCAKLAMMWERLQSEGFTSYWV